MLLDFVLPDKVSLEELGTTKKLCITFLLRSGLLFCFNPSSNNDMVTLRYVFYHCLFITKFPVIYTYPLSFIAMT